MMYQYDISTHVHADAVVLVKFKKFPSDNLWLECEVWATFEDVEFSDSSIESSSDSKAAFGWFDSTSHVPIVSVEVGTNSTKLSIGTIVGDGASNADLRSDGGTESESYTEVITTLSTDWGATRTLLVVLSSGLDVKPPAPVSSDYTIVCSRKLEGCLTVSVAGVSRPSVLQKDVLSAQLWGDSVKSDHHGDEKRGIQSVVIVKVIVDEVVGGKDSFQRAASESWWPVEVVVHLATVEFVTENTQIRPWHPARGSALHVWCFVLD